MGFSPLRASILRGPSSFRPPPIPVQTSSLHTHGTLEPCPPLSEDVMGTTHQIRTQEDKKTTGITPTPILTYKSNVSATRKALEGSRACPFSLTDSYVQGAAGPSQAWAHLATGWGWKRRQMEGPAPHYRRSPRERPHVCLLGRTVERAGWRPLAC